MYAAQPPLFRIQHGKTRKYVLNDDEKDRVKREVVLYSDVEASENATKIGTLSIELDGKTYKKLGIFASKHAKNTNSIWDKIRKMFLW